MNLRAFMLLLPLVLSGCGGLTGFTGVPPGEIQSTLTGKITRSDTGDGLAGARVVFGGNETTSGADGSYQFAGVTVVSRQTTTTVTASLSVSLNQFDCTLNDLTFTPGDTITQDVDLDPHAGSGTVKGTVVSSADGTPIADALVSIGIEDPDIRSGRTANDGTFQITGLFPGALPVKVERNGFLTLTGNADVVDSSGGAIADLGKIKLVPSSSHVNVTGTVKDGDDSNGIVGATVTIGDQSTTTGAAGAFTVNDVLVGQQTVKASATGYTPVQFTTEIKSPPDPLNIVLFKSGVQPPGQPFNLTGTVTLSDTANASGVTVTAIETATSTPQDSTTTGSNGIYKLFVPPAQYTVRAAKTGYQTEEQTVTVPPGGQIVSNVNFTLTTARSSRARNPKSRARR